VLQKIFILWLSVYCAGCVWVKSYFFTFLYKKAHEQLQFAVQTYYSCFQVIMNLQWLAFNLSSLYLTKALSLWQYRAMLLLQLHARMSTLCHGKQAVLKWKQSLFVCVLFCPPMKISLNLWQQACYGFVRSIKLGYMVWQFRKIKNILQIYIQLLYLILALKKGFGESAVLKVMGKKVIAVGRQS